MSKKFLTLVLCALTMVWTANAAADIDFDVSSSAGIVAAGDAGSISFMLTNSGTADVETDTVGTVFQVTAFGGADLNDLMIGGVSATAPGVGGYAASNVGSPYAASSLPFTDSGFFSFSQSSVTPVNLVAGAPSTFLFSTDFSVVGGATELGGFNINVVDTGNLFSTDVQRSGASVGVIGNLGSTSLTFNAIPEPGSAALILALGGMLAVRRRR